MYRLTPPPFPTLISLSPRHFFRSACEKPKNKGRCRYAGGRRSGVGAAWSAYLLLAYEPAHGAETCPLSATTFLPSSLTQCSIPCILTCMHKPASRANHVGMYTSQHKIPKNKNFITIKSKMYTHSKKCILSCSHKPPPGANHVDMYTSQPKIQKPKNSSWRKPTMFLYPIKMYTCIHP
jgi:hypothetical protein